MAEYIERDKVRDMLHSEIEAWGNSAEEIDALLKANDALFDIPAADVAPVVRCRDCKRRERDSLCEYFDDDDFCSYGERKDGE